MLHTFDKNIFQEQVDSACQNSLKSDLVGPGLGTNCLQRLSADDKRRRKPEQSLARIQRGG